MTTLQINDLTVRDGNQSLLATRMQREDILSMVRALDKVGFHALEVWGGATFDSAFRFLKQSAWENLREIRRAAPNTKLSMLLRGQNLVGYHHYDNDTLDRFIRLTIENGMDIIRCFDALNDPNNVRNAFTAVKKYGAHLQAAIAYTVSPVHDNEYYVHLVKTYEEMGADSICIKDMAGILTPENTYALVHAIKQATDLPINLHSHTTANATSLVMEEAMRAGVDIVDGCISPFSGGTSHLADETLVTIASLRGRQTNLDAQALSDAYEVANQLADKYIQTGDYRTRALIPNPKILTYQVPGGMLSNLFSQLEQQKAGHRLNEVLQEVPRVRKDLGYPPLVTPLSQMTGTQAVLNVLLGDRYKMAPKEIKDYCMGYYGKAPGVLNAEAVDKILQGVQRTTPPAIEELPSLFEESKDKLHSSLQREVSEEEVVAYILFPQQVLEFLQAEQQDALTSATDSSKQEASTDAEAHAEQIAFRMYVDTRRS